MVMLKPPNPGSLGDSTSIPPPPSCSPFSGKASSNTTTDSFAGGYGEGCVSTVTDPKVPVHVVAGATGVQAAGTGAPPMPWPQVPGFVAVAEPLAQFADRFVAINGLAASPGSTDRSEERRVGKEC